MSRLDGKIAIVTGGARGAGEDIVRLFVAEGAQVVIFDVLEEEGTELARTLGASASFRRCDVTSEDSWRDSVGDVVSRHGRLDILVNNAGILHLESLEDTSVQDYIRVFQVNELGVFLGVRTAIHAMKGHGGGSIVNISSVDAVFPSPNTGAYAASKYAIEGITRVAALELRPDNIRVNAVAAGYGSAGMLREATGSVKASRSADGPEQLERRRLGAKAVMFLASDDSAFITGAVIPVDNGKTAGESLSDYARRKANVS